MLISNSVRGRVQFSLILCIMCWITRGRVGSFKLQFCLIIYYSDWEEIFANGPFSAFFNEFEIFNGPFIIFLHNLWWAILQVNGTMAHGPLPSQSLLLDSGGYSSLYNILDYSGDSSVLQCIMQLLIVPFCASLDHKGLSCVYHWIIKGTVLCIIE